jgi:hypothetical protein
LGRALPWQVDHDQTTRRFRYAVHTSAVRVGIWGVPEVSGAVLTRTIVVEAHRGGTDLGAGAVAWAGSETVPDSPMNLFPPSLGAGWSCLLAAAGEASERVRLVGGGIRVGAGRCCSHNEGPESDSSADQYFRDHSVVLSRHVIFFPLKTVYLCNRFY